MPRTRSEAADHAGVGTLRVQGDSENVQYRVKGDLGGLRQGHATLRGAVTMTPAFASEAFKSGDGVLTAESGAMYRVRMLAHTVGTDVVFVELRI